jgi:hypothetical protein
MERVLFTLLLSFQNDILTLRNQNFEKHLLFRMKMSVSDDESIHCRGEKTVEEGNDENTSKLYPAEIPFL